MQISLKNIKYSAFASHDSHCFEATVYVDGKRAFGVENDGHGGPNNYFPLNKQQTGKAVQEWIDRIDSELGQQTLQHGDFEISNCLTIEIGERINEWLLRKEARNILRRVTYLRDGQIFRLEAKFKPSPATLEKVKQASWWQDDFILLNELPREEAIAKLCVALK